MPPVIWAHREFHFVFDPPAKLPAQSGSSSTAVGTSEQANAPLGDMELAVVVGLSVLGLGAVVMWLHRRAPMRRARYIAPAPGASEGPGTGTSEGRVVISKSVDRVRILPTHAREQTGQTTHGRVTYRAGQSVHQPVSVVSRVPELRVPERRTAWV